MRNYATVSLSPSAYITKGKQRIKQNEGTVYLQNGDTFEIELYNPTQNDILAKIDINQQTISGGGIVLRPGERVFLERYLDDAKKFKFETYQVDDSFEGEMATMKNGWVTVSFHKEKIYQQPINWVNTNPYYTYYNSTGSPVFGSHTTTIGDTTNTTFTTTGMGFFDNSVGTITTDSLNVSNTRSVGKVETGKIEKGGVSNQMFTTVDKEFDTFSFHNVEWRILPKSRQPLTAKDLNKRYCTECGAKVKKSTFKFCPHCGNKLD